MVDSVSFIQSLWLHWCVNESLPEAEFILGPAEPVNGSAKSQTLCSSVLCCLHCHFTEDTKRWRNGSGGDSHLRQRGEV